MNYPPAFSWLLPLTFALSAVFTGGYFWLAQKKQLLPTIRDRDVHKIRKPRVGGVAMWSALLVILLIILGPAHNHALLNFGEGGEHAVAGILEGMGVILLVGVLDDLYGLKPAWQLLGQFLVALTLVTNGIGVPYIRVPFHNLLYLNTAHITLFGHFFFILSDLFTIFWVIIMMNVMNFFDGLDGLAGSVALTSSAVLVLVSLRVGVGFIGAATLSLIVLGITAGFLPWNWHPAKIFMGTVGSQLLGFLLATIAIISGGKVATAVLVLGVPFLDAFIVIGRRLLAHTSPFEADQRHLHHRLLKIGLPVPYVVLLINVVAVAFGFFALQAQSSNSKGILTLLLVLCMLIFIAVTYLLEQKALKK